MCAGNAPAWANQELQQGEVTVVGLQARVIGASIESIDPRHLAGCQKGTPATGSHLLPQASTVRLLDVSAHQPGLGDTPTSGLGSQPLKHMSMSRGEPHTGSDGASLHATGPCEARHNARRSSRRHVAQLTLQWEGPPDTREEYPAR